MAKVAKAGFTAVELLVTLFIATVLIAGAYQIYGLVSSSSGDARERNTASNYAYEALRRISNDAPTMCSNSIPTQDITSSLPSDPGIPEPYDMSATFSCPYGVGNNISQLNIRLRYGPSPQKEIVHAIYVRAES